MPSDFTVIQAVRQRFGETNLSDDDTLHYLRGPAAPFVGQSKQFSFSCPNVDSSQMGMLQFETIGVEAGRWSEGGAARPISANIIRINGSDIPGGITPAPGMRFVNSDNPYLEQSFWKSHSLVVPANLLREKNALYVEAGSLDSQHLGGTITFDNFIIDNVVVFFKTRQFPPEGGTLDPNLRATASR